MGSDLDWVLYKERKLVTILKSWDAKDGEGKPVPVNQENIFNAQISSLMAPGHCHLRMGNAHGCAQ
jgi:hypothetical protein